MKILCELDVKNGKEIQSWHPRKDKIVGGKIEIFNKHETHFYEIRVTEMGKKTYIDVLENGVKAKLMGKSKRMRLKV